MTGVTPVPPLRVTEPVWVPAAKAPVAACNVTVPLPVPEPALRVNQPAFSLALQVKVPPPVLRMLSVCAAGFLPPWIAVNARLVGLAPMAGGTGAARDGEGDGDGDGASRPPLSVIVPAMGADGQGAGHRH